MNKQFKIVDGVKVNTAIEWTDYTWNPIAGCQHGCAWTMPDGTIANCYAEDVANRLAQKAYPQGFEHHYWKPQLLTEVKNLPEPSKIFVGSMADVFGHWVPKGQIQQVLDVCRDYHWHTFQFLTKNPERLRQFDFPSNCWVGISSPPDEMLRKHLSPQHQRTRLLTWLRALDKCNARVKWISIEPLAWDIAADLWDEDVDTGDIYIPNLKWVVIGAASSGRIIHQPKPEWVRNVLDYLDSQDIPVFMKGNIRTNPGVDRIREDFPEVSHE